MFAIQSPQQSSRSETEKTTDNCTPNILPCRIHHDGPTGSISRYWTPVSDENDKNTQTAFFRGRRLRGRRVAIPEGYQGIVAMPTERLLPSTQNKSANEEVEQDDPVKVLEKQATFDEIVVWGHEAVPASDDTFVKGVEEWAKMAKVVGGYLAIDLPIVLFHTLMMG
ncbi:hypothetical protein EYZ11_000985 [Aspergillus tanneri]|uniref:Uncharacterized protein n=1 Tax=Aspergillus tanneri TaxID=1220188 RepID=A0A4S3JVS5_9EURO|nr:hypothetical protein EYZ11_000985 [Aspergillus tanneri]